MKIFISFSVSYNAMEERQRTYRAFDYLEETIKKSSKEQFLEDCRILGKYILETYKENELTKTEAAIFLEKIKELADIKKNENIENPLSIMNIPDIFSQKADRFMGFSKDLLIELRNGIKNLKNYFENLDFDTIDEDDVFDITEMNDEKNILPNKIEPSGERNTSFDIIGITNEYTKKPYITMGGYHVRSKAEVKIANFLHKNHIICRYEPLIKGGLRDLKKEDPLRYDNLIGYYWKIRAIQRKEPIPDFYLLEYDVYIEYWGQKEKDYIKRMREKKKFYKKVGMTVINLYPENLDNIGYAFKKEFKKAKGYDFPIYLKYPRY